MEQKLKKICIILIIISIIFPTFYTVIYASNEEEEKKDIEIVKEETEGKPIEEESTAKKEEKEQKITRMEEPPGVVTDTNEEIIEEGNAKEQENNTILLDGIYQIESYLNSNLVIEVANGSKNNSANIQLGTNRRYMFQRFQITNLGNGIYEIKAVHSGKSVDVAGGKTANSTNIQQYNSNNSNAQKWIIQESSIEGYYNIKSVMCESNLDIKGAKAAEGTNVQLYKGSNTNKAQMFKFVPVTPLVSEQTIPDGTYQLQSYLDKNLVVDVKNLSKDNSANIQIATNNKYISQKFKVKYLNDGYYEIRALHSNKLLDVQGGNLVNSTNVQQYQGNNSDAQKWIIKESSVEGYYNIISKASELYLDIKGAKAVSGTNVQTYKGSPTNKAQMFKFVLDETGKSEQTIPNGTYQIQSYINKNLVLDVANATKDNSGNIQIATNNRYMSQRFKVTYLNDGYYEIKAIHSGKVLDVKGGNLTNKTNVQQYQTNNSNAQKWIIKESSVEGYYNIISKANELYLDVNGGKNASGTNIQTYKGSPTNKAQMFKFVPIENIKPTHTIDDGVYYIQSALNTNYVLNISGSSNSNGGNVILYPNEQTNNEKFEIKDIGNGYYTIKVKHSGKLLDAAGAKFLNGTNVQQYQANNSNAQKWIIKDAGNGYYYIISKHNELAIDVTGAKAAAWTNIQLYKNSNGNKAQMFRFVKAGVRNGIDVSEWQGNIDWAKAKKSGKAQFAIIRVGYRGWGTGRIVEDAYFKKNVEEAAANKVDIGLYFFTQAINEKEAIEEANYVLNLIKEYNVKVSYPIYIDTESSGASASGKVGRADGLSVAARTKVINAFIKTIENAGYRGGVYASRNWFYEKLDMSKITLGETWLAHYTYDTNKKSDYIYPYQMWQWTSEGSVSGIKGNVDRNVSYY